MNELARRIQREHNRHMPPAEFMREDATLMFSAEGGYLGVWTDHAVATNRPVGAIPYRLHDHPVSKAEVQAYLDSLLGVHKTAFDLYGTNLRRPPVDVSSDYAERVDG